MHFGSIVKKTAENGNISVEDMAWLMECPAERIQALYDAEEWTSGNIKAASEALNYDFGTYLNRSVTYDFSAKTPQTSYHETLISVKYPIGKENQFEAWAERIWLMAKNIGLGA